MNKITRIILVLVVPITLILILNDISFNKLKGEETTVTWQEELSKYVNTSPELNGAIVGLSVRSATSGAVVFDHMGDTRLRPASNMKLLTAASALSTLGGNYQFTTEILTDGVIQGDTLVGNLVLKGKGDPTLLPSDLEMFAQKLREKGIKKIEGDVLADDSWYDEERYSKDLVWSDESTYYGAGISALTISPNKDYDAGTVIVEVEAGEEVGDKAIIDLVPNTEYIKVINKINTIPKGEKGKLSFERSHGTNTIVIKGTIPIDSLQEREWVSVWEPTGYALEVFKESLERQGISWSEKETLAHKSNKKKVLVSSSSIPISELLVPFMKLSNNGHAETLVKEMGKVYKGEGSWEKGIEVMNTTLKNLAVDVEQIVIRDGSGLSHVNLIPANEITKLLYQVQNESWFPSFLNSLPVAGVEERLVGGTLRYRLNDTNVKAKTGTLSTVSSLSGYVTSDSGHKLIFSILCNNVLSEDQAQQVEDEIVQIIAKG
ncbi:D-alanyl-D-alanine carboxypeptidase/D-alanyl-D-alanine endopeptidase [Aquibacillus kalidii]|uniref:D-alanyl-D-alanine carboxypeptidase/D-alanyl-D-alanine endopeptidase n=1 Tax=Aquibacillus kalidii TaxID=2762597 RepID=UPI0016475B0F|nr:D-alanyl-D-alanine carboxypeptidase/D-alanyl-D-alanine-endopeptidase [Aquibacillus kalidii]